MEVLPQNSKTLAFSLVLSTPLAASQTKMSLYVFIEIMILLNCSLQANQMNVHMLNIYLYVKLTSVYFVVII